MDQRQTTAIDQLNYSNQLSKQKIRAPKSTTTDQDEFDEVKEINNQALIYSMETENMAENLILEEEKQEKKAPVVPAKKLEAPKALARQLSFKKTVPAPVKV